ncbi:YqeG family HAD IIIA-type phosphatase, partial [Enterocloster bolteae]|nr:YqeG family HAD IIIA-type phosphatase [Enterocloster bolteae]
IDPKEEIQIVLKRYLEKIVLHFYKKRLKNERN